MIVKRGIFVFLMLFLMVFSVAALEINTELVRGTIINDHDIPGVIKFTVTSTNESGDYSIFTTEKFQLTPSDFSIASGETKSFEIEFLPIDSMRRNSGHIRIPYSVRKELSVDPPQTEEVALKLISFSEAFVIRGDPISPNSEELIVSVFNVEDASYENVQFSFSSVFFDEYRQAISLQPYEVAQISVPIDSEKTKKLVFGEYSVGAEVFLNGKTENFETTTNLLEKTGIETSSSSDGFIVRQTTIERTNRGNVPTIAEVHIEKNIISRLFTTFSSEPVRVEREGISVSYYWQEELQPDETLSVSTTTNWIFPFLLLIAVIIIGFLANLYFSTNLLIRKKVDFVKTSGGEFALKVTLRVKAKKFMDDVTLMDSLPGMSQLYEKFGNQPTKIDHRNNRLVWEIGRLGEGEERFFSYILYSKLKVVGKFELPRATGVYNIEGKLHEVQSNKVFFIHEPAGQSS